MKLRCLFLLALAPVVAGLTGCASIVNGTQQSISVQTTPMSGARCALRNSKGEWYVPSTPGSVVVHRAFGPMNVDCRKGSARGRVEVKSHVKGMAFGNAVFGGVIGAGVDTANGAAFDYPQSINVPMRSGKARPNVTVRKPRHGKR